MRYLLLIVLLLGIFFRFTYLDHKVYWYDEAITSLRGSGYTEQEVGEHFFQKSVVSVTELQHYQHPDGTRSIIDTTKSLAKEVPYHSPLYFILANLWFQIIGSSLTLARLLPALLSLLAFPSAYWLCQEIFVETEVFCSKLPSYLMVGLIAVSPFHVLYAQESRQYSLWIVMTLLSTAALLWTIRLNTRVSWCIYMLTLVINLYSNILAGLTIITHGIYVVLVYGFRHRRIIKGYLVTSALSVISFFPIIWLVIINQSKSDKSLDWTYLYSLTHSDLKEIWIQHLGRIFFDVNQDPWDFYVHRVLLVSCIYAFYSLCRQTPMSVWLMIVLLIATSTLPLMMPDWILGGQRSITARYMIPGLLGVQLAMTYLLGRHLASPSLKFWYQKCWQLLLVILFSGSILSCAVSSQATVWYNKGLGVNGENIAIGKIVNQTNHPLLISDTAVAFLLSLSHSLKPTVQVLLKPSCNTCAIQSSSVLKVQLPAVEEFERFSDVFLYRYNPSKNFVEDLAKQKNYRFEPLVKGFPKWSKDVPVLWRVIPIRK